MQTPPDCLISIAFTLPLSFPPSPRKRFPRGAAIISKSQTQINPIFDLALSLPSPPCKSATCTAPRIHLHQVENRTTGRGGREKKTHNKNRAPEFVRLENRTTVLMLRVAALQARATETKKRRGAAKKRQCHLTARKTVAKCKNQFRSSRHLSRTLCRA